MYLLTKLLLDSPDLCMYVVEMLFSYFNLLEIGSKKKKLYMSLQTLFTVLFVRREKNIKIDTNMVFFGCIKVFVKLSIHIDINFVS